MKCTKTIPNLSVIAPSVNCWRRVGVQCSFFDVATQVSVINTEGDNDSFVTCASESSNRLSVLRESMKKFGALDGTNPLISFLLHFKKAFDKFCIGNRIFYSTLRIAFIIVLCLAYLGFSGSSDRAPNVIVITDSPVTDRVTSTHTVFPIGSNSSTVIDTTISTISDVVTQTEIALTTDLNDTTIGTTVDILDPIV